MVTMCLTKTSKIAAFDVASVLVYNTIGISVVQEKIM
jgi:hypothetical protein